MGFRDFLRRRNSPSAIFPKRPPKTPRPRRAPGGIRTRQPPDYKSGALPIAPLGQAAAAKSRLYPYPYIIVDGARGGQRARGARRARAASTPAERGLARGFAQERRERRIPTVPETFGRLWAGFRRKQLIPANGAAPRQAPTGVSPFRTAPSPPRQRQLVQRPVFALAAPDRLAPYLAVAYRPLHRVVRPRNVPPPAAA